MKIAFIGGRDIHQLGGIENYMYNLGTQLVRLGHEPIVYCESDREAVETVNGIKVIYRKSKGGRFLCKIILGFTSTLHALKREKDVRIFHYNAWPPSLWSWIPRLCGRKTILQGHGFEWRHTKYSAGQRRILKFMEYFTAKSNTNLIMVSDEQTKYFKKHYHTDCRTIPCAVNLSDPADSESDILDRFALEGGEYFLFLGRLGKVKNPDVLIRAFCKANLSGKKLVIAGNNNSETAYVDSLYRLARDNGRIVFTGAVYGRDKECLLKHCCAFCLPSSSEGMPISLLEAMSYGRVCIATAIEGSSEALGDSGIFCRVEDADDLADKLRYVAEHYDRIAWQERYNRQRVAEHFTWDAISRKYVEFIESL